MCAECARSGKMCRYMALFGCQYRLQYLSNGDYAVERRRPNEDYARNAGDYRDGDFPRRGYGFGGKISVDTVHCVGVDDSVQKIL